MEEILSHPVGPLPWALATAYGIPRKTNKATLSAKIQKVVPSPDRIPANSASIIDGMSLVQKVRGNEATFGDITKSIISMALGVSGSCSRVDIVFDTYKTNSIKSIERAQRGEDQEERHQLKAVKASQIVRQWRSFLCKVSNKTSPIEFLVDQWAKEEHTSRLQEKTLFVTVGSESFLIKPGVKELVPDLCSSHEEAVGRILLHAAHAADQGRQAKVICSEDTDVFIMAVAYQHSISKPLFQRCGIGTRILVFIRDIGKIATHLGHDVCKALVGLHAFTGCDSVSAFAGKGKISALNTLEVNKDAQSTF